MILLLHADELSTNTSHLSILLFVKLGPELLLGDILKLGTATDELLTNVDMGNGTLAVKLLEVRLDLGCVFSYVSNILQCPNRVGIELTSIIPVVKVDILEIASLAGYELLSPLAVLRPSANLLARIT